MTCQRFEELVNLYLDGLLSEEEAQMVEEHMASCTSCRETYESLNAVIVELRSLPLLPLPQGFEQELHAKLMDSQKKPSVKPWYRRASFVAGIAATLLLAFAMGVWGSGLPDNMESLSLADMNSSANNIPVSTTAASFGNSNSVDVTATAAGDGRTTLEGAAAPVADEMDLVAPKADTFTTDKLIYTADVALRSYQFDQDYAAILSRIDEAKGYAGSTSVQGLPFSQNEGTGRIGSIEANIPQEQYQSFIEWLSTMGEITSNNQQVTNVSQQYTQVQIRIDSLQKQITRLQELIGKAENVADLIQLETQLSSVTTELEYMQSQMDSLDMQISYSTVNVTLTEMESAQTQAPSSERTFGQRMKDALAQGWKRFTGSLQSWSLGFIKALPYFVLWLVVLAVAIGIVMLVIHTRRRRKKP